MTGEKENECPELEYMTVEWSISTINAEIYHHTVTKIQELQNTFARMCVRARALPALCTCEHQRQNVITHIVVLLEYVDLPFLCTSSHYIVLYEFILPVAIVKIE